MRATLIIPALNEAESLGPLLAEVPRQLIDELIVVDNGSSDSTSQVSRAAGARVVDEPRRGYGYACAAGTAHATGEVLIYMDGDGSYVPAELVNLLAHIERNQAGLVLGSRFHNRLNLTNMPSHQRMGNQLFTAWLRKRYNLELTDLGPFRAVKHDLLLSLEMQETTYGWPLEMIIKAARCHTIIVESPVTYRPRFAGQSKVSGTLRGSLLTAYRYLRVMLVYA